MENNTGNNIIALNTKQLLGIAVYWAAIMSVVAFVAVPTWITVPIVLIGVIGVIGMLLSIVCNVPLENVSEYVAYSISFGLAFALIGGLLINWLLPYVGIVHPLATVPVTIFFDIAMVALALWIYANKKNYILTVSLQSNTVSIVFALLAPVFVIVSCIGAEHLNNGGNGAITVVMLVCIGLYVGALIYWKRFVRDWVYMVALYGIALAVLLMYSLRSIHIIGWDINQEYEVFQTTLQHLAWHASYYAGLDYNACVSITILPTMFAQLTHVSSEYVFKFLFQMLFAFSPVMVFVFAKRYLHSSLAFLAGFLFLSQTWFFEQMPGLVRQEIAFLFFIALLLALFDDLIKKMTRYVLLVTAIVGIILSHYSTAYVTLIVLIAAFVLSYLARFIKPFKKQQAFFKPLVLVGGVIILLLWQIPVTQTIGKFTSFITNDQKVSIPAPAAATSQNSMTITIPTVPTLHESKLQVVKNAVLTTFFVSGTGITNQTVQLAQQKALSIYMIQPGYQFYPHALTASYVSTAVNESASIPQKLPHALSVLVSAITKIIKLIVIDIFPLIGIAVLYREFRSTEQRKTFRLIVLAVAGCLLIAGMILIPYIQHYYNFTRLFLQMFTFLSTAALLGAVAVMNRVKHYELYLTGLLVLVFLSSSGVIDQLTGGPARLTLNQPPSTMDALYIHDAEIAGAHWLVTSRNYADPVETDAQGNLRLESFANFSSGNTAIFPQTINPKGYIYVTTNNLATQTASYEYQNELVTYNYPFDFIKENKDLIYNSGGSEIYH